jgi:cell division protein FtsZ
MDQAEDPAAETDELPLAAADEPSEDELLLGDMDMVAEEPAAETPPAGRRTWLTGEEEEQPEAAAPKAPREGGTLFERMSNIARGAAKAQVEEEGPRMRPARDPLDIPRFLNRQNNQ